MAALAATGPPRRGVPLSKAGRLEAGVMRVRRVPMGGPVGPPPLSLTPCGILPQVYSFPYKVAGFS